MSLTVYKYPLKEEELCFSAIVPLVHKIVHIGHDGNQQLCIWAEVHEYDKPEKVVKFKVFGTGWTISNYETVKHFKTVVENNGLVWHYYQIS